ncbi:MAG: phosphatidylglycerophosphatase A [Aliidongia sp.]
MNTPGRFNPAFILATWFGTGYAPVAPGSWGSAAALPFAWAIAALAGSWALVPAAAVLFLAGWAASNRVVASSRSNDPQIIVVDEVVGQWLTPGRGAARPGRLRAGLPVVPCCGYLQALAGWLADRRVKGGLGVMLDDVLAALYSAALLWLALRLLGR